jgi:N-glycosylase/DNA lyase
MLNPKKSAKYYLKKANYNREEAKELVYKQVERVRRQCPRMNLSWMNKAAYYADVTELIDNIQKPTKQ